MQHNKVLLGVTPLTKPVFDQEFPELQQVQLPAYNVSYTIHNSLWLKLLFDSGRIRRVIDSEHGLLKSIVKEHHIDVVISDNRFGLWNEGVHTVFITHQLFLKAPVFSGIANRINRQYIKRFNEVWVPDVENAAGSLSGELSHGMDFFHPDIKYIGPQSRLQGTETVIPSKTYHYLALLSGPEPQRTILENILLSKLTDPAKSVAVVRGASLPLIEPASHIDVFDFPDPALLRQLILCAGTVICRSGYSTLMDLYLLNKKNLVLVPTPGQTEQEYLAGHWHRNFGTQFATQPQLKNKSF